MKRKLDKKGVALEMAITFLLLIFALSSLMTTLALVSRSRLDVKKDEYMQKIDVNRMGENFCREVCLKATDPDFGAFTYYYHGAAGDYYARVDTVRRDMNGDGEPDEIHTLRVYSVKNSGYTRLFVKAYADEGGCHVLNWTRFDYDNYSNTTEKGN